MVRAYPTIPSPTPFDPHPRSEDNAHGLKWMQLTTHFGGKTWAPVPTQLPHSECLSTRSPGPSTVSAGFLLFKSLRPVGVQRAHVHAQAIAPAARNPDHPVDLDHLSQRTLPPCPLLHAGPDSKAPAVELVDPKPRHLIRHYPLRSRKRFPSAYPRRFPCPGPLVTVRLLPDGSGLWTGRSSAVGPRERRRPRSLRTDHRAHYSLSAEPCPWPAEFTELHCTARHRQHPCRAARLEERSAVAQICPQPSWKSLRDCSPVGRSRRSRHA